MFSVKGFIPPVVRVFRCLSSPDLQPPMALIVLEFVG